MGVPRSLDRRVLLRWAHCAMGYWARSPTSRFLGDQMKLIGTGLFALAMLGSVAGASAETRLLGRTPQGCPSRSCGCIASLKVFGRVIPRLNLAENWATDFQEASPGDGMAAARRGHVFILLYHVKGDIWHVYDGNTWARGTGRHAILEHDRSIRGFKIVDPHQPKGTRYAERRGRHERRTRSSERADANYGSWGQAY